MSAEGRVAGAKLTSSVADAQSTWTTGAVVSGIEQEGQGGELMNTQATTSAQVTTGDRNTVEFDEAALAAASISGDPRAFEKLYTHYFPKVRALCIRKIGNAHLAEDIAQEAFARAFERISEFGGPRHFGGWVGTIAANLCTDHLRRKKPVASVDQMIEANESAAPVYEFDPIRNVQRADTGRLVRMALEKLDPRQREALVLHEIKGLSCAAVGERLGITEVAAESLLARARRRLRKEVTAKAIPADLFGLGGLGVLPALLRGWKRIKTGTGNRVAQAQSALNRGWDSVGGQLVPSVDAAKALVVVMGAALAAQAASAAAPPVSPTSVPTHGSVAHDLSTSGGLIAPDGDEGDDGGWSSPVRIQADPRNGTATASVRGDVHVPDPTNEETYTGVKVDLDLEGEGLTNSVNARVYVEEADGSAKLDSGEISHDTDPAELN